MGVVESQLPRLGELVSLHVELVEELGVEGDIQQRPQATPFSYPRGTSKLPVVGLRGFTFSLFRSCVTEQRCLKTYIFLENTVP